MHRSSFHAARGYCSWSKVDDGATGGNQHAPATTALPLACAVPRGVLRAPHLVRSSLETGQRTAPGGKLRFSSLWTRPPPPDLCHRARGLTRIRRRRLPPARQGSVFRVTRRALLGRHADLARNNTAAQRAYSAIACGGSRQPLQRATRQGQMRACTARRQAMFDAFRRDPREPCTGPACQCCGRIDDHAARAGSRLCLDRRRMRQHHLQHFRRSAAGEQPACIGRIVSNCTQDILGDRLVDAKKFGKGLAQRKNIAGIAGPGIDSARGCSRPTLHPRCI